MTAAAVPLWLAVFGIVLRGAGFAFRKEVDTLRWQRVLGATFALSSLITPFFMGTVVGAVASGRISVHARHTSLEVWTGPTSLLIGGLFVAVCAYLAAVYLIGEAAHRDDQELEHYYRRRAIFAGTVSGALSLGTLAELHDSGANLYHGLTHRALPLVIVAALCGLAVMALLVTRRVHGPRPLSALGVAAVLWGWASPSIPPSSPAQA